MLAEISAVRREEKHCAIERAAFAFDDTHHEIDVVCSSHAPEIVNRGAGDVHTAFPVTLKIAAAFFRAITDYGAEIESARICGEEGFWKNDELRAFRCSFCTK